MKCVRKLVCVLLSPLSIISSIRELNKTPFFAILFHSQPTTVSLKRYGYSKPLSTLSGRALQRAQESLIASFRTRRLCENGLQPFHLTFFAVMTCSAARIEVRSSDWSGVGVLGVGVA